MDNGCVGARLRKTRQLLAIQDVVSRTDRPISIDEILRAAKKREPRLGVATVYRAIKTMLQEGRLVSIVLPGESPRFELAGKGHHHHFQCTACGRVFETKACLGSLGRLVPRSFQLTGHELILYGRCAACRM